MISSESVIDFFSSSKAISFSLKLSRQLEIYFILEPYFGPRILKLGLIFLVIILDFSERNCISLTFISDKMISLTLEIFSSHHHLKLES